MSKHLDFYLQPRSDLEKILTVICCAAILLSFTSNGLVSFVMVIIASISGIFDYTIENRRYRNWLHKSGRCE